MFTNPALCIVVAVVLCDCRVKHYFFFMPPAAMGGSQALALIQQKCIACPGVVV
jgi:hypothetical protein